MPGLDSRPRSRSSGVRPTSASGAEISPSDSSIMSSCKTKKARIFRAFVVSALVNSRYDYIGFTHAQNGTRPWQGRQQAHLVPHTGNDIPLKVTHLARTVNST